MIFPKANSKFRVLYGYSYKGIFYSDNNKYKLVDSCTPLFVYYYGLAYFFDSDTIQIVNYVVDLDKKLNIDVLDK